MALNTSVVDSGGGGNFLTWAAWEAAQQGDFGVTWERGEGVDEILDIGNAFIMGGATGLSPTNRWEMGVQSGAEHGGVEGGGCGVLSNQGGNHGVIGIDDEYVLIDQLDIDGQATTNMYHIRQLAGCTGHMDVFTCLMHDGNVLRRQGTATVVARWCSIWDVDFGNNIKIEGNSAATTEWEVENCTLVAKSADTNVAYTGIRYCKVTNDPVAHFGGSGGHKNFLNTGSGSNYCADDGDGTAPGANSINTFDPTTEVTSYDNHHIDGDSVLQGVGTDLSNGPDFDGDALTLISMGCDDGAAAGGGRISRMVGVGGGLVGSGGIAGKGGGLVGRKYAA